MGLMRKTAVYLGLVEDDGLEYAEHEDDYVDTRARHDEPRYTSVREVQPVGATRTASRPVSTDTARRPSAPISEGATAHKLEPHLEPEIDVAASASDFYRITTLHPRTYNDARRIGEEFREGTPVIMNLTEMDDVDAKRIVDFSAGLVFGQRGTIERVTNKVFLLSPNNVDVAAEARRLAQDGFFNQS